MLIDLSQASDVECFGSKAANICRLLQLGLPTPGGAVIPDTAHQAHLRRAGVLGEIRGLLARLDRLAPQEAADVSRRLRERITAAPLPDRLQRELNRRLADGWRDRALAVRSSAVGEDSREASFAGQLESFLNIRSGPALAEAVRQSWGSLWSPRALLYAKHFGIRPGRMGVILQEQVEARLSGVLFTRDPRGNRPDGMMLEYCAGLGDRLVGGSIDPARLIIDRSDLSIRVDAPAAIALDARDWAAIETLARMALVVEARFGTPQDIEWCIDQERRPVLLQARPITRLGDGKAARMPRPLIHWCSANIAENYPEPVCPFLYSIVRPAYTAYFRNVILALGLPAARLETRAHELENTVGLHAGRLYYNLTNIHALQRLLPDSARLMRYFQLFVGSPAIEARPPPPLTAAGRLFQVIRVACHMTWRYLGIGFRIRAFERRIDRFARQTHPDRLATRSALALAGDLRGFLDIRMHRWTGAGLADNAAMMCYGLLKELLSGLEDPGESTLHNGLLKGLPGLASIAPVHELWKLSRRIRAEPALASLFADSAAAEILKVLTEPRFQSFHQEFARYLDRWGFRFSGELMLTAPTPRENPLPVLRLLQSYAGESAHDPIAQVEEQARSRQALTHTLARRLTPASAWRVVPVSSRASRFRLLLRATHAAIRFRERARMKQALLYTRLRHIALQIGDRLVRLRSIDQRDDVFLLTTDEVLGLLQGNVGEPADLRERISARRRELEQAAREHPPEHLALPEGESWRQLGQPQHTAMPARGNGRLAGLGASAGTATGEAAVLMDVSRADELRSGQVLVTPQTDPGWASVFFLARGLVVERGGMLSHGAIIAREYGIPAVVGVAGATSLIQSGDIVDVDGNAGHVHVHHA